LKATASLAPRSAGAFAHRVPARCTGPAASVYGSDPGYRRTFARGCPGLGSWPKIASTSDSSRRPESSAPAARAPLTAFHVERHTRRPRAEDLSPRRDRRPCYGCLPLRRIVRTSAAVWTDLGAHSLKLVTDSAAYLRCDAAGAPGSPASRCTRSSAPATRSVCRCSVPRRSLRRGGSSRERTPLARRRDTRRA
jgi:hypothetical protein